MADIRPEGIAVLIIGDHPWTGHTGTLLSVHKPSIGILPPMGLVRLDEADDVPPEYECFAEAKHLKSRTKCPT